MEEEELLLKVLLEALGPALGQALETGCTKAG
jgi:hypothetical protein